MKYAVVACVYVNRGLTQADNDEGDVLVTDLTFEEAVKYASKLMYPVAIIPVWA